MSSDVLRTRAYEVAIMKSVKGKVVMDIGTGGEAVLAILCAENGASHVFAVEVNGHAAESARRRTEHLRSAITIIEGYSASVGGENIEKSIDLFVHEIFGEIASREGIVHTFIDAYRRFFREPSLSSSISSVVSIPYAARTLIVPAQFPPPEYWSQQAALYIVDPQATLLPLPSKPNGILLSSNWEILENLVFGPSLFETFGKGEVERKMTFSIESNGTFSGLLAKLQARIFLLIFIFCT